MAATKGNGRNAGHAAPAKTFTKHTANFIAAADRCATADAGLSLAFALVALQAALLALAGVLQ